MGRGLEEEGRHSDIQAVAGHMVSRGQVGRGPEKEGRHLDSQAAAGRKVGRGQVGVRLGTRRRTEGGKAGWKEGRGRRAELRRDLALLVKGRASQAGHTG